MRGPRKSCEGSREPSGTDRCALGWVGGGPCCFGARGRRLPADRSGARLVKPVQASPTAILSNRPVNRSTGESAGVVYRLCFGGWCWRPMWASARIRSTMCG